MSDPVDFHEVYRQELSAIRARRRFHERAGSGSSSTDGADGQGEQAEANERCSSPRGESPAKDLVGLALSGGGVRSAGFNLGLVQAMDERGVFSQVDYLSTVSGGVWPANAPAANARLCCSSASTAAPTGVSSNLSTS